MKNRLITALFVLLLTPGLLFAARPSISAQEQALTAIDQKLDETNAKIDALTDKVSALADSVDRQFSTGTYISARLNPWTQLFPSELGGVGSEYAKTACTSFCWANWADQSESCNEVCSAAATGELSDCSADASASLAEKHGFISACAYGGMIPSAPVNECTDTNAPATVCLAYTREVMRVLYDLVIRYERGH
jgi:hypothetical protein